ncbi:MAG: quinate 5-dehydrogenase [Chlorobia bacterium]|nr:quinate 5-dehydrogenase [Fimbriimonadaceae bacterium]
MKHVVSVSLGSSKRNKTQEVDILGESFKIERIGVDGDLKRFGDMFAELDGQVDALGVGGADVYVVVGEKRYAFRQILKLVARARKTPVVDGSGLKHTLERTTIETLQREGIIDFKKETTLLVSAVDRFGMAQALDQIGGKVIYGDLLFGIGLPFPIHKYKNVRRLGASVLPIITRMPFKWFYPTGEKQEERKPKHEKIWKQATVVAGDTNYIRRYAPDDLKGKTVITQTVRMADLEWLKQAGVQRVITTTPMMGGETFATNVMEGVIVALVGKKPDQMTEQDYLDVLQKLDWKPNIIDLST